MIRRRHPSVAGQLVNQLQGHPETPFLRAAAEARRELMGVMAFEPQSWQAMLEGARPPLMEPEDAKPGTVRRLFPCGEAVQGGALRTRTCSSEGSRQVARRSWSRGRVVCSSNKPGNDVAVSPLPSHFATTPLCTSRGVLARICRKAQGRVRTNVMVRDMDLPQPDVHDGRRLEVVVDGLPLRGGAQLVVARQWFARCTATAGHVAGRLIMTGLH